MTLNLSFDEVCSLVKSDTRDVSGAIDKLASLALICAPIAIGAPAAAALLPTLAVKNEIVKLVKPVIDSFLKVKDDDFVAKHKRMQVAHGLLCFTAFFEALDRQMPRKLREKLRLRQEDKIFLSKSALDDIDCASETLTVVDSTADPNPLKALVVPFPHPTETFSEQIERHTELWKQMAQGFQDFVQHLAVWEQASEKEQAQIVAAIGKIHESAATCFEAQYFELARRYEDFAIWANFQDNKKAHALIGELSEYVKKHTVLSEAAHTSIDVGFNKLHDTVITIPETLKISQAAEIVDSLTKHYRARINEPIIEGKDELPEDKPRLAFPRVADAFVPQAFRVLRYSGKTRRLEEEATWRDLPRRDDLGAFLLSYLSSPYSTDTPLVVLGHPGSGKSLLTTVLSAQLMSKQYTTIRVPLREVDADSSIVTQIEDRIRRITSIGVDSWAKLSGAFKNSPPIVILDGYDELLQASGKVFSNYLKDIQTFQRNETEQGRPVRVIVTSRVTLIDKATIPLGATIVRLLEFDKRQRERWISIWNATNATYFKTAQIEKFALPPENQVGADKVLSLAEQPLLLLMLALYDSEANQLRKGESLDRTMLYDSLLRRFVDRERSKDKDFDDLADLDREKALDREMQRLAVAALGMYNRRKLHILSPELNQDIDFFSVGQSIPVSSGRPLSEADLLLGSFFFVHKSKAQHIAGTPENHEETSAFEFLHNTFGEFLTADFVLNRAVAEVQQVKALKENEFLQAHFARSLDGADGLSREWYASLIYTPLFTRPVVLEMMREWIGHLLKRKKLSKDDFISYLDIIILNQLKRLLSKREMPSIFYKETIEEGRRPPFGDHPLLGHIAIYSINLIVMRAIVTDDPFVFNENEISIHEDGARPWDRLTHLWRSWFSLDNLNGMTAVISADRKDATIEIRCREQFQVVASQNRLETHLNVALALGDNVASGLAGLFLYDPSRENRLEIDDIADRLASEKIDLQLEIAIKRILHSERFLAVGKLAEFVEAIHHGFKLAIHRDKYPEIEQIVLSVRRSVQRMLPGAVNPRYFRSETAEFFRSLVDPRMARDIAAINPSAGLILYQVAGQIGDEEWAFEFRRIYDNPWGPEHLLQLVERTPDAAIAWLQLEREVGGKRFSPRFATDLLELAFDARFVVELSERNPQATVIWLQLVLEISAHGFHKRISAERFEQLFQPDLVLDLAHRNPEAALVWLQLARELGGTSLLRRRGPELIQRAFPREYLRQVSERNPQAALAWVTLMREFGADGLLDSYREEVVNQILNPSYVRQMSERYPEAALALLQLARELLGEQWLERDGDKFFELAFHPSYLSDLIQRNPEAALAWLRLARELGGAPFYKRYGEAALESSVHARSLRELGERNPEALLIWIQLAHEVGGDRLLERNADVLFGHGLRPSVLARLVRRSPAGFALALRMARTTLWTRAVEALDECLVSFHDPRTMDSMVGQLPITALPDIQWLADQTGNGGLHAALKRILGNHPNQS